MIQDYAKAVFRGEKKLLKNGDVKRIDVKKYEELSVKNLYEDFLTLNGVAEYFPDSYPKGRCCDRDFMFNVVHTLYPEIVKAIIDGAHKERHSI